MTGIDEHRRVAGLNFRCEPRDRAQHFHEAEIVSFLDGIAFFAQQVGVALRVGFRLLQRPDVLVDLVADDEREPLFGERRSSEAKPRQQHRDPSAHERLPPLRNC